MLPSRNRTWWCVAVLSLSDGGRNQMRLWSTGCHKKKTTTVMNSLCEKCIFFFIGCLFGWVGVLGNSLQRCWRCEGCSKQVIYSRLSASFAFSSVHPFLLSFAVHFLFSVLGAVSVSQLPRHKSSSVYSAVVLLFLHGNLLSCVLFVTCIVCWEHAFSIFKHFKRLCVTLHFNFNFKGRL